MESGMETGRKGVRHVLIIIQALPLSLLPEHEHRATGLYLDICTLALALTHAARVPVLPVSLTGTRITEPIVVAGDALPGHCCPLKLGLWEASWQVGRYGWQTAPPTGDGRPATGRTGSAAVRAGGR